MSSGGRNFWKYFYCFAPKKAIAGYARLKAQSPVQAPCNWMNWCFTTSLSWTEQGICGCQKFYEWLLRRQYVINCYTSSHAVLAGRSWDSRFRMMERRRWMELFDTQRQNQHSLKQMNAIFYYQTTHHTCVQKYTCSTSIVIGQCQRNVEAVMSQWNRVGN